MSLDVSLQHEACPHCGKGDCGCEGNITHNLSKMASEAGIYDALWHPERLAGERSYPRGHNVLPVLKKWLEWLKNNQELARTFNPENGWGDYEGLVGFVEEYIDALEADEDAIIKVSR